MISLVFAYRSVKKEADLRLFCRSDSFAFFIPTQISVVKEFWDKYRNGKQFKGGNLDMADKIRDETTALKKYVQSEIDKADPSTITKDWLKKVVHEFYNPPQPEVKEVIPHNLLGYLDYYLRERRTELSVPAKKKWNVIKNKLKRFEKAEGRTFEIKDLNGNFKNLFIEYCKGDHYSLFTIQKELKFIKMLALHAEKREVPVSKLLGELTLTLNNDQSKELKENNPIIYLSFDELDKIKAVEGLPDYLDNARDWLIISCHTAQRVSDLLRFDKSMIGDNEGAPIIKIVQEKTGKEVEIPIIPVVAEILEKRGGDFPRPISDQRYNEYIKEVCKRAKLNQKTKGRISKNVNTDPKGKSKMRNVIGLYPKWMLISSHVGRRSFVTNYRDILGISGTMEITGHTSEKVLMRSYAGKGGSKATKNNYVRMLNATK